MIKNQCFFLEKNFHYLWKCQGYAYNKISTFVLIKKFHNLWNSQRYSYNKCSTFVLIKKVSLYGNVKCQRYAYEISTTFSYKKNVLAASLYDKSRCSVVFSTS